MANNYLMDIDIFFTNRWQFSIYMDKPLCNVEVEVFNDFEKTQQLYFVILLMKYRCQIFFWKLTSDKIP